jgi:hypothetical protein
MPHGFSPPREGATVTGKQSPSDTSGPVLILFYNTLWGFDPDLPPALPHGVEVSFDRARLRTADAVIFHIPDLKWWWRPRKRRGQIWIAWSKECEEHHPRMSDGRFMSIFDLRMTYRRDADVPHTYIDEYLYAKTVTGDVIREKLDAPLVASFVSSKLDRSGREQYITELGRHIEIDAYGRFMRNRPVEGDNGRPFKLATIARYKFTLAFENACRHDYVTEKFFEPLAAGSVPVYLGAPNIEDFAPGDCSFIDVRNFRSPAELARHLHSLAADEAEYQEHLAWRRKPLRPGFSSLLSTPHWFSALCARLDGRLARS